MTMSQRSEAKSTTLRRYVKPYTNSEMATPAAAAPTDLANGDGGGASSLASIGGPGRGLGWVPIQFIDFDCIFTPDLSRWRAIVMAKSLFWLSDEAWKALSPHLPRGRPGKPRVDDRTVISGILHVLKTGCRWRDVPPAYGPPTTIYNRYNRWSQRRVWQRIFEKMAAAGPIPDELSIDSSHIKAHRSASGSKRGSLKKRSAARGAEERARFMLWPTIAADRSLSR
jgi:transposase